MLEEITASAEATSQPTEASIHALVAQARAAGFADAEAVASMCAVARQPGLVAGFIRQRISAADVGAYFMAVRVAAEEGTEIDTSMMPGSDGNTSKVSQGKARPWKEIWKGLGFKTKETA